MYYIFLCEAALVLIKCPTHTAELLVSIITWGDRHPYEITRYHKFYFNKNSN